MTLSNSVSEIRLWRAGYKPCSCRQSDAQRARVCFFWILAGRLSFTNRCRIHDSEFPSSLLRGTDSAPRRICLLHHYRPSRARDRVRPRPPSTCVKNLSKEGLGDCSRETEKLCCTVGGHDMVLKSTFKEKTCARPVPVFSRMFIRKNLCVNYRPSSGMAMFQGTVERVASVGSIHDGVLCIC